MALLNRQLIEAAARRKSVEDHRTLLNQINDLLTAHAATIAAQQETIADLQKQIKALQP